MYDVIITNVGTQDDFYHSITMSLLFLAPLLNPPVPVYCVFIFYYINTVDVVHVATVAVLSSVKFILFERLIRNFIHIFLRLYPISVNA
jgi:hypothetical protein